MALVRHIHKVGSELTPEERAAIRAHLDEAAKYPITFDKDCPQLTDEQLAEFRPVNGMTWKERAQAMRADGTTAPDTLPAEALVNTP
ncbi:hypothetical protein AGMMS49942_18650 [Spirochaetia bacterium]|nr:hypothetical protein AGMMS49942_18650 [Spirochaetia bacterium]